MTSSLSPISVETARKLVRYNGKVFARYARAARKLPWRVASEDRGTGHGSIFQTLVHILNVHEVWIVYIAQGRSRELNRLFRQDERKPTTWSSFEEYSQRVWKNVKKYVDRAGERQLNARVKAPWMPGRYSVGDAVLQTTVEQAHHLGEIIGIFWQMDREPPEMTWIDVNRSRER